jgi:multiple antibiotic resistance protein
MERMSFVFTILFMLVGPLKIIPAFAGLTQGTDGQFKRAVAVRGALIAAGLCAFVCLAGLAILGKYHIQMDAVRVAGGVVLLVSALNGIFKKPQPPTPVTSETRPIQIAASPVAVPMIVPHAGVAALLLFLMGGAQYPGMTSTLAVCLAIILALDFLVMYFIDHVLKIPGLMLVLFGAGAVLVFVQACLATQMILTGLKMLGPIVLN